LKVFRLSFYQDLINLTITSTADNSSLPLITSKNHAPAYIVPYARELIANITSRTGILPTLVMPPLNIVELLKEVKEEEVVEQKD